MKRYVINDLWPAKLRCVMCHDVGCFPHRSLNYGDECIIDEKEEKTQNIRERNYMSNMVCVSLILSWDAEMDWVMSQDFFHLYFLLFCFFRRRD